MIGTILALFPRELMWLAAQRRGALREYAADHSAICDALESGDAAVARRRAEAHVERAASYLRVMLERNR
jgi:DNA-binding FadR family transcriptional regulator